MLEAEENAQAGAVVLLPEWQFETFRIHLGTFLREAGSFL